jgi:hypothetical protein
MKKVIVLLMAALGFCYGSAQQNDWSGVEKVFGKKGAVQDGVFKITYPRSDLKVKVGDFSVEPGLALTSWIGFMKTISNSMEMGMNDKAMIMGDLVLLDKEVAPVILKIISEGLEVTALHNHIVGETPAVKYVHFSGKGDAVKLAEAIKAVFSVTGTPFTSQMQSSTATPDWSKVEAVLGKGKHNGILLQYGFPRSEKLTEGGMEMPAYMGMATAVNFQMSENKAAITGDFVLLAEEVNPVVKALTENAIAVTAIHNHMLYDNPRLFMVHFWAINEPEKLAKGIKAALDKTNSKK